MLKLRAQGVTLRTIIDDFISKYSVSEQALYQDWRKRVTWASQVVQLDDPALINELIQGLRQIIPNAWYEYKTNPNPSVKLGALKLAKETYMNIIEVLQSIGIVVKLPEKLEVTGELDLNLLAEYEQALERARQRNIQPIHPTEQVDTTQTNTETS